MEQYKTPFDFKTTSADGRVITIQCLKILRSVPGRRLACLGRFQDQDVFVKIFFHKFRAERHWQRESRGIQVLLENNIPVPGLLFAGVEKEGPGRVLVQEQIQDPVNVLEQWDHDPQDAFKHIEKIISIIAKMHLAGISQQDIHPDNFLLTKEASYCIDTAMLTTSGKPLTAANSVKNVALFTAQFPSIDNESEKEIWRQYCQHREEGWYEKYLPDFGKEIINSRQHRAEKLLNKLYRTSTNYIFHKSFKKRFCIKKSWYQYYPDGRLIMPETLFAEKNIEYLKQGGSSTVIKTGEPNKELVIKRYNIKNTLHALKRAMRRTRASRSWSMGHLLQVYGINTPAPVAFIEFKLGPIMNVSYFICEYIPGPNLIEYFSDSKSLTSEQEVIAEKVVIMLDKLARAGIYHGDMKATNLVVNNNELWLLDLDGMCWYQDSKKSANYHQKDVKRFLRNWPAETAVSEYFRERLNN